MASARQVNRFALYGERAYTQPAEFVHIEPISRRSRLHEGTIAPHAHPEIFQMLLLEAGAGSLATDGDEAVLAPGALVALPAGCVHAFHFGEDAEGWVLSIAIALFDDQRIAGLCGGAQRPGRTPRWLQLDGRAQARLAWLFADLAEVLAGDRAGVLPDAVAARLALVLTLADEQLLQQSDGQWPRGVRDDLATRFRTLVELHFRDGWSVVDYALRLGATTVTLTRASRDAFRKAPGEVVLDRILLEAMRSLIYSTAPVSQIADDLGFADGAYFARFFKVHSGMTASAFRRTRGWFTGVPGSMRAGAEAESGR
jgi:AraC family transcriptional activator of pobA